MVFKFDSEYVFLTYPHSAFDHQTLFTFLNSVCTLEWARIATEAHEDGEPHVHVVGQFKRRYQTRNERAFDYEQRHPNIQKTRNVRNAIKYLEKDGQFSDFGTLPVAASKRSASEVYEAARAMGDTAEFWILAADSGVNFMYAKKLLDLSQSEKSDDTIGPDWTADLSRECFELMCSLPHETKSTVVIGPTGCGKTSWACRVAEKPALWVRHVDVLLSFKKGFHKSIIFDDLDFAHIPRHSQIFLTDKDMPSQVHCRYKYAKIPAGVSKIFTCNHWPFTPGIPEVERRCHVIKVINPVSNPFI